MNGQNWIDIRKCAAAFSWFKCIEREATQNRKFQIIGLSTMYIMTELLLAVDFF